ncbi:MAG: 30S ribosomal protein S2 [Candidatus Kapaibacteriales bacterium]
MVENIRSLNTKENGMNPKVSIEELLKTGAHFGHLTRRWNPKMEKFIFTEKNGIHIIDLRKTQILLELARQAIYDVAASGRVVLFVGTKNQAKAIIEEEAIRTKMNYVTDRWLGGMLTNFATIRKSIKRLHSIEKMAVDGTYEKITKKERLLLDREKERLRRVFGGIENLTRLPGALFVVDIRKEHLAIKEAQNLGIPVFAITDTNTDPTEVDFPIPANDDSIGTISLITKTLADSISEGTEVSRAKQAEFESNSERIAKEQESEDSGQSGVQRKMRERKRSKPSVKKAVDADNAEAGSDSTKEAKTSPDAEKETEKAETAE